MRRLLPTPSARVAQTALLALLAAGCASSPAASSATTPAPATSTSAGAAPTTAAPGPAAAASPAAPAPDVQRLQVTVRGGQVSGDTGTVQVALGRPVELTVTSDVADEVHVHGADVGKDVDAGGTVVVDFVQRAPGRFEVELEKRKQTLLRLQVS